jgi:FtsP/CotA-like multicopper oxidase with cupredoxin domain
VIEIDGKPVDPVVLQDTVWVGHHQEVKIRIHFKHFVGKALLHCHILSHGDAGMMQNVLMTG